jgi:hypothetical protein
MRFMASISVVFLFACSDDRGEADASVAPDAVVRADATLVDTGPGSGLRPAPMGGGFCCPIETPSCNCFRNGGWAPEDDLNRCGGTCDLAPPMEIILESHGCEVLTGPNACNRSFDASTDAGGGD